MAEEKTKWVICASCGYRPRNHRILYEKIIQPFDDPPLEVELHRLVQCMGCESIKYVISTAPNIADLPPWEDVETDVHVYPDSPTSRPRLVADISQDDATDNGTLLIPTTVWKMYKEAIDALNANIRTLAAGGLRATVEAICLHNKITKGNLQDKINELTNQGLLTSTQAELLHEERYLGNAALHELETPSAQDIEDGIRIVEGLINTIYVLPAKAQRLKARREFKKLGAFDATETFKTQKP
jgi:hypothetical protein